MANLETAMSQSPDNAAINFGIRGWVVVVEKVGGFEITTEDHPHKPSTYASLDAVRKAVELYDNKTWEPRELDTWD